MELSLAMTADLNAYQDFSIRSDTLPRETSLAMMAGLNAYQDFSTQHEWSPLHLPMIKTCSER